MMNLVLKLFYPYWENRLTVLAYHRIVSDETFAPRASSIAVSTCQREFMWQMQLVNAHFSIITVEILQQWLQGQCELPKRPAIITFDDGYEDIYSRVAPIMEDLQIPATVFLPTAYIGTKKKFLWDIAGYCFSRTTLKQADLPLLGKCFWRTPEQCNQLMKQWLNNSKTLSDCERQTATRNLAKALDVEWVSEDNEKSDFLSWDQVRELLHRGFSFGGHSCHHPILSKISRQQLGEEISLSKQKIEMETGQAMAGFAYPNGLAGDYNDQVISVLKKNHYILAFTLLSGPTTLTEVRKEPFQIHRITVTEKDIWGRFILKLIGIARLKRRFKGEE